MTAEEMIDMVAKRYPGVDVTVSRDGVLVKAELRHGEHEVGGAIAEKDGAFLIYIESADEYEPLEKGEAFAEGMISFWFNALMGLVAGKSPIAATEAAQKRVAVEGWRPDGLRMVN